jgi:hypothetical protein
MAQMRKIKAPKSTPTSYDKGATWLVAVSYSKIIREINAIRNPIVAHTTIIVIIFTISVSFFD